MPAHGSKRLHLGEEQIFHHDFGWISVQEFYDRMPEPDALGEDSSELEPDFMSRQSGESSEHFRHRIREENEYSEYE